MKYVIKLWNAKTRQLGYFTCHNGPNDVRVCGLSGESKTFRSEEQAEKVANEIRLKLPNDEVEVERVALYLTEDEERTLIRILRHANLHNIAGSENLRTDYFTEQVQKLKEKIGLTWDHDYMTTKGVCDKCGVGPNSHGYKGELWS